MGSGFPESISDIRAKEVQLNSDSAKCDYNKIKCMGFLQCARFGTTRPYCQKENIRSSGIYFLLGERRQPLREPD
jgi:hypothetical protein